MSHCRCCFYGQHILKMNIPSPDRPWQVASTHNLLITNTMTHQKGLMWINLTKWIWRNQPFIFESTHTHTHTPGTIVYIYIYTNMQKGVYAFWQMFTNQQEVDISYDEWGGLGMGDWLMEQIGNGTDRSVIPDSNTCLGREVFFFFEMKNKMSMCEYNVIKSLVGLGGKWQCIPRRRRKKYTIIKNFSGPQKGRS